ncbi:MAG: hypothetical protein II839_12060, partial [Kiritimatiellae bacterium]|nr:hypothetical protein [Kiritimatiellia bacterium]
KPSIRIPSSGTPAGGQNFFGKGMLTWLDDFGKILYPSNANAGFSARGGRAARTRILAKQTLARK